MIPDQLRPPEEQETAADIFIVRQPILKRDRQVFGFRLLYDGEHGAPELLANIFLSVGLKKLGGSKPIFIRADPKALTGELLSLLPKQSVVFDVPAESEPSDDVLDACRRTKAVGHRFSADGSRGPNRKWLTELDYLRVNFTSDCSQPATSFRHHGGMRMIADQLDTEAEFAKAVDLGYDYFQGLFFAHPTVVTGKAPTERRTAQTRILKEVAMDDIDLAKVERLIQEDVGLTYKLLRYINSAGFGWRAKIKSVRHAVSLLGACELRKWVCLVMVMMMGGNRAAPLFMKSLIRARFGELLAQQNGLERIRHSMFLLGLLSHLDGILQVPLEEALSGLSLDAEIVDTLLKRQDWSSPMQRIYLLIEAYETGDWVRSLALLKELKLPLQTVTSSYVQAVEWAESVSSEHM